MALTESMKGPVSIFAPSYGLYQESQEQQLHELTLNRYRCSQFDVISNKKTHIAADSEVDEFSHSAFGVAKAKHRFQRRGNGGDSNSAPVDLLSTRMYPFAILEAARLAVLGHSPLFHALVRKGLSSSSEFRRLLKLKEAFEDSTRLNAMH